MRDASNGVVGRYYYDGEGRRVKKEVPATGETTIFVYDAFGKLIAEYSTQVAQPTEAKVSYLMSDHLGSPRVLTEQSGKVYSRRDFMPFGEEIRTLQRTEQLGYGADAVRQKFTGYERDSESGLDFAQARYFHFGFGRFFSPDPILSSASIVNPQSWNRYSYTLNNPLKFTDPTGMFVWSKELGGSAKDEELMDYFTSEANKITDEKKRRKALKRVTKMVKKVIKMRNKIRAAIAAAKELINSNALSDTQKAQILRSIKAYGEEGENNNVILGLQEGKGGRAMFGEDNRIAVFLGKDNKTKLMAVQFVHEGSHVADMTAFNNGEPNSDITLYETEKKAYTVGAYAAQGLGLGSYNPSDPENFWTWRKGWTEADIAEAVKKKLETLGYTTSNQMKLSVIKPNDIESLKRFNQIWNVY
ncbi:MAG: hypothetical protein KatS3mg006_0318 [Pyrinomonadaceae bacterium]|nr:MAG: hypothetical protein KatS3mg006_0318 [Pyrinomonadaceae bacterium]